MMRRVLLAVILAMVAAFTLLQGLVLSPRDNWLEVMRDALLFAAVVWVLVAYNRWIRRPKP